MDNVRNLVREILEKGYLLSLATVDKDGVWVSDVVYVNDDDFNIYWLSLPTTRHSKAIASNPNVAATITTSTRPGEEDEGVQIEGVAEKISGNILEMASKHLIKRGKPAPKKSGEIFEPGQSWYRLKPRRIELIYEKLFRREKKVLEF